MNNVLLFTAYITILLIAAACGSGGYDTDGEAIFHTGKTMDGTAIQTIVDKSALPDPNVPLACADCHGIDAKGGKNTIPSFGPYVAPDITWSALTDASDGTAYTEDSFIATLQSGVAPEGYRLHHPMPRWEITDAEGRSLIEYLKTK